MSKLIAQPQPGHHRIEAYGLVMDVSDSVKYLAINSKGYILGLTGKPVNFSDLGLSQKRIEVYGQVVVTARPEDTLVWVGIGNPPPEKEIRSDTLVPAMIYGNERVVPDYVEYYAVSPSGNINCYSEQPTLVAAGWIFRNGSAVATIGKTDPTDWQNSLRKIEKVYDDIPF